MVAFTYNGAIRNFCDWNNIDEDGNLYYACNDYVYNLYLSNTQYTQRHNTLFNLYAFDSMHSERTHAPTLNLIDCDFKYFFNQTSLIQVETNNFVELGLEYTYTSTDDVEPFNKIF